MYSAGKEAERMKSRRDGLSRREALGVMGLLALSGRAALGADTATGGVRAGIALQLYTVRELARKDLDGTLKKAAEMGWRYVQWSGMPSLPADQIRAALDKAGLSCIACHTSMESFEKDFDKEVAFWKTVGNKDVAPGGMMKDCTASLAAWINGCKRLDALGAKLRAAGMRLSFHNHSMEFDKFPDDPRTKHQILMDETKPENLGAELDIAWAHAAGVDVPAYIRKLAGRIQVVHAKDLVSEGKKHTLMPLGQGSVPWPAVFAAGREAGIEWYVYEQDGGKGEVFDYVKASYDFLSKQSL
jgi:sugar phosphate isomerase/epimerase